MSGENGQGFFEDVTFFGDVPQFLLQLSHLFVGGLQMTFARECEAGIAGQLPFPARQDIVLIPKSNATWVRVLSPRMLSLTASRLNSRSNFLLRSCIVWTSEIKDIAFPSCPQIRGKIEFSRSSGGEFRPYDLGESLGGHFHPQRKAIRYIAGLILGDLLPGRPRTIKPS